jgi:aminoglycoside phosphotransferase (APT) family kinase protein
MAATSTPEAREMRSRADRLMRRLVGRAPRRLVPLAGGITNHVLACDIAGERWVVRLNADAARLQDFLKQQWALDAARKAGVPAPEALDCGVDDGTAYLITQHVSGKAACDLPQRLPILEQLGQLAARVHASKTSGFGQTFDWSANTLSKRSTWGAYLDQDLRADERVELLVRHGLLSDSALQELKEALAEMRRWRRPPALHHGDLRLKNVITTRDGERIVALIDWDNCLSAPVPHWDLSIALHDLGLDEQEAWLRGYGLPPRRMQAMAPFLRALNAINYVPVIGKALRSGDRSRFAWLKARLSGSLSLTRP